MTSDEREEISEAEEEAFYELANAFIEPANDLMDIEPADEIAAAFLYACARYNAFAMQIQVDDPSRVDDDTINYLCDEYAGHLQEHMEDPGVCEAPGSRDDPVGAPERVANLVETLGDRDEDELWEFRDIGDKFIHVANGLNKYNRPGQISAAFMHACARFNVFVMVQLGHPSGEVDEGLVARFRTTYEGLLRYHLSEQLIEPNA